MGVVWDPVVRGGEAALPRKEVARPASGLMGGVTGATGLRGQRVAGMVLVLGV